MATTEEKQELKIKSFRITEETAEAFRKVADAIGGNQQETMAKLIEVFQFQSGKAQTDFSRKKEDIEKFQRYSSILSNLYLQSLEETLHAEEVFENQFHEQLSSKDALIADQQASYTKLKRKMNLQEEELQELRKKVEETSAILEENKALLEEQKAAYTLGISERDNTIRFLSEKAKESENAHQAATIELSTVSRELKEMKNKYTKLEDIYHDTRNKLNERISELEDIKDKNRNLEKKAGEIQQKLAEDYETKITAVQSSLELKHKTELLELRSEYENRIIKYQQQQMEHLKSLYEKN